MVKLGERAGFDVIMCRSVISARSAMNALSFSTRLVIGFVTCSASTSRSMVRVSGSCRPRIAMDVEGRRVVEVDVERRRIVALGQQQPVEEGVDLADLRIGAGHVDAVAIGRARRATDEVVVFVRGNDEQGVVLVDAVGGETREEFAEGDVIGLELGDVFRLARAEGMRRHPAGWWRDRAAADCGHARPPDTRRRRARPPPAWSRHSRATAWAAG